MKKVVKKEKNLDFKIDSLVNTVDTLAMSIAKGFDRVEKKIEEVVKDVQRIEKDVNEIKESNKGIRRDILNLGDRFVSYNTFDALAKRVKALEEK
ncbi:MAG: hypothetical protein AAB510_02920 [Patescibacteria group bacterium]